MAGRILLKNRHQGVTNPSTSLGWHFENFYLQIGSLSSISNIFSFSEQVLCKIFYSNQEFFEFYEQVPHCNFYFEALLVSPVKQFSIKFKFSNCNILGAYLIDSAIPRYQRTPPPPPPPTHTHTHTTWKILDPPQQAATWVFLCLYLKMFQNRTVRAEWKQQLVTYFRPVDENMSILLFSQATQITCLQNKTQRLKMYEHGTYYSIDGYPVMAGFFHHSDILFYF